MKTFLKILIVLCVLAFLFFYPLFPMSVIPLSPDTILSYSRVGGVAGFYDRIIIAKNGEILSELPGGKLESKGNLSDEKLAALNAYISSKSYTPIKFSLFKKLKSQYEDSVIADQLSVLIKIKTGSKTIEIQEDDFIRGLLRGIIK